MSPNSEETEWVSRQINDAINPLQQQIAALMDQLQRMESAGARAEGQRQPHLEMPSVATPSITEADTRTPGEMVVRRKPLPDPPKFTGIRKEYAAWSQQMRSKISLDAYFYPDRRSVWYLINACLGTGPQQVVSTFYAAGGPGGSYDSAAFMEYLDRTYKDSNLQSRAANNLRTLRQGESQSLASFLPKFEQALADSGGAAWPDSAKITYLEGALNSRLQHSLVAADLPDDYHGWLRKVQDVAGRLQRVTSAHRGNAVTTSVTSQEPLRDQDGDQPITGVNRINKAAKKQRLRNDSVSSTETYTETRMCFGCGKKGHLRRNCPRKSKARRITSTQVAQSNESDRDSQEDSSDDAAAGPALKR